MAKPSFAQDDNLYQKLWPGIGILYEQTLHLSNFLNGRRFYKKVLSLNDILTVTSWNFFFFKFEHWSILESETPKSDWIHFFHRRCIISNGTDPQVRSLLSYWSRVLLPPVASESWYKGHSFSQLEFKRGGGHWIKMTDCFHTYQQ